jgi:AcrR family transcriptional regulator
MEKDAAPSRGREDSRGHTRQMQRRRLLDAMTRTLAAEGFRGLTVTALSARADVSPSIFRELFGDLDGCLLALLEQIMERSMTLAIAAFEREQSWQDGVLAGLEALLLFLDSEPLLARVCLVDALAGSPAVLELRSRLFACLVPLLDGARSQLPAEEQPSPLTSTAVIASVAGILQEQFVHFPEPIFIGLLGELSGLVVAPYLGISASKKQIERGNARAAQLASEPEVRPEVVSVSIPKQLRHASAFRMRLCLLHIADNPGVSNQEVARGIDMSHHGQISKALSRLHLLELLAKRPGGSGHPNAWWLTPYGEQVAHALEH